jgi:hypothetical protein
MLRPMISSDRRARERRGIAPSNTISLGAVLADERRERRDRRELPRRRSDLRTIAHYARRIEAGHTRLEVIVDGTDGLRLVAMFQCGCVAVEPVGAGPVDVRVEACIEHAEPPVTLDRRRGTR